MSPELAQWIPLLQIITNATLTLVGICIAVASLIVAYRNNFGWKPFVMNKRSYVQRAAMTDGHVGVVELEIWNRRKYPVAIRGIVIKSGKIALRQPAIGNDMWKIEGHRAHTTQDYVIPPSSNEVIKFEFSPDEDVPSREMIECGVHVLCFDPRTKKETTLFTLAKLYAGKHGKGPWA